MKRKTLNPSTTIIIAAIVTGIFGLINIFANLGDQEKGWPEVIPSITPKPTVVGTPKMSAEHAASGKIGEIIFANDIKIVVDEVHAYPKSYHSSAFFPGYAFVVVKLQISNGSTFYVAPQHIRLVDIVSNEYASWSVMSDLFDLPALPGISIGQSGSGALVFQVPEPALSQSLRLSLRLGGNAFEADTLLVVFFDDVIELEQP